jgi:hypothetical protein
LILHGASFLSSKQEVAQQARGIDLQLCRIVVPYWTEDRKAAEIGDRAHIVFG